MALLVPLLRAALFDSNFRQCPGGAPQDRRPAVAYGVDRGRETAGPLERRSLGPENCEPWQPAQPGLKLGYFQTTCSVSVEWQAMQVTFDECGL